MREKSVSMARRVSSAPASVTASSTASREQQEQEGPLPPVELSHDLAAPLRILGSTTP